METLAACLGIGLLVIAIMIAWIFIAGAVIAFLWNAVLVDALALSLPTINLWVGMGIAALLWVVGGFFRSTTYRSK